MVLKRLKYGTDFCAVECTEKKNFHLLELKERKKELELSGRESFQELDDLLERIKGIKHLFLVFNNEQVLSKTVDFVHSSEERIIKSAFPNITLQDFYTEVMSNEHQSFVSIARKESLEEVIQQLEKAGTSVIDFSLGNLGIRSIAPFLEENLISTSNAKIELEQNQVLTVSKQNDVQDYHINGLDISSQEVLSLAGIISYYSDEKKEQNSLQQELKSNYFQKRFFDLGLKTALGFLFLTLLINFLFFANYRDEYSGLRDELALNETYKKQLMSLQEMVSKKKKLVESMSSASDSKITWYFDAFMKSVPGTVLLEETTFQPLASPIREKKEIRFDTQQILVRGISKSDEDFTNWVSGLEQEDWIDKVVFVNYGSGKKRQTSFDFIIDMK